ncbi:MAG: disulfide bond formation protein B [Acidiferrobacterales bacterium]
MNLIKDIPKRWFNLGGFFICVALLGYAYYLETVQGLEPCPLCIFQRFGVAAIGVAFLVAGLHDASKVGSRVYGTIIGIVALAGAGIAARHVWIQNLPAGQIPDCGADLEYLLEMLPLVEVIKRVITRSGECADVTWAFVGLSMPSWVLIWCIGLGALGLIRNWMAESA